MENIAGSLQDFDLIDTAMLAWLFVKASVDKNEPN